MRQVDCGAFRTQKRLRAARGPWKRFSYPRVRACVTHAALLISAFLGPGVPAFLTVHCFACGCVHASARLIVFLRFFLRSAQLQCLSQGVRHAIEGPITFIFGRKSRNNPLLRDIFHTIQELFCRHSQRLSISLRVIALRLCAGAAKGPRAGAMTGLAPRDDSF